MLKHKREIYFLSNRADLNQERIGAKQVREARYRGKRPFFFGRTIALLDNNEKFIFASPKQIVVTDGRRLRGSNSHLQLPFIASKGAMRQSADSVALETDDGRVLQPEYAHLHFPRNKCLPVSETKTEQVFAFLSRLPIFGKAIERKVLRKEAWVRNTVGLLLRHDSIYLKPAGATGSGAQVCRITMDDEKLLLTTSDNRFSSKLLAAGVEAEEKGFVIARGARSILIGKFYEFLNDSYWHVHSSTSRTDLIAEQEIRSETVSGRRVDLRYLLQLQDHVYVARATYAKVGGEGTIVSNLAVNGEGSSTSDILIRMIQARFPKKQMHDILEMASGLDILMKEMSEKISNKLVRDALSVNASRLRLVNPLKNVAEPLMIGVDYAIVYNPEKQVLEPWLMEVNHCNVLINGLKTANPKAYWEILERHENNLAMRVQTYLEQTGMG